MRLLAMILSLALVVVAPRAWSQTLGETALRAALQLTNTRACGSAKNPLNVVALPAVDASQSLSEDQIQIIRSDFLATFSAELPSCARLTDAVTAFGTVAFMTEVDITGGLTKDQQDLIESRLQNAHSILALKIDRIEGHYRATVQLTSIKEGQTISVTRYDLPEDQTSASCGGNAVSEQRGLSALADDLLNGVHPIQGLHVEIGRYQDTDQAFGYGAYLTQQFLSALTQARNKQLFGTDFRIKLSDDASERGDNEYTVSLRYWVCDQEKSAKVVLSALSPSGETGVFTRTLSLAQLPSGIMYKPDVTRPTKQPANSDAEINAPLQPTKPFLGLVTVSPARVTTGDLLIVSAEPPANCNPFFFDLAPGGRLTPLPLNIFDITEIRPGLVRYDNNAASKYGIAIQVEDERGMHRLGFICQRDEMTNEDIRNVFQDLRASLADTQAGVIEAQGSRTIYNTSQYAIID